MHNTVWHAVKKSIKTDIPNHAFNTWISPIKPVALNKDELILEVPNQFFYEWLDTHYRETIKKKEEAKKKPASQSTPISFMRPGISYSVRDPPLSDFLCIYGGVGEAGRGLQPLQTGDAGIHKDHQVYRFKY